MDSFESFRESYDDGETVFVEGSQGDCAYLIEHGAVEISILHEGKPTVLATRVAGEIFGEMAIVDKQPRSATARAVGEAVVLRLSEEQFKYRLDAIDPVMGLVLRTILERVRETLLRLKYEIADFGIPVTPGPGRGSGSPPTDLGRKDALDRVRLERDLERGLNENELILHYQPIVDLAGNSPVACEALIRWNHPHRGLLSPATFLSLAEDSYLMRSLGQYVFEQACAALAEIASRRDLPFAKKMRMHVNISPKQLLYPNFLRQIADIAHSNRVETKSIVLEITERLLIDQPDEAMSMLNACIDEGFQIALDDFGTGYSSLAYLSRFPLSEIKIDRSFISNMHSNSRSIEILNMLCSLANTLELRLVAEGIESQEQADAVRQMGCPNGQGYLFGRPMPLAELKTLLSTAAKTSDTVATQGSAIPAQD